MIDPQPALSVPAARVRWRGEQPVSAEFQDIYHAADGPAEVERVLLAPLDFRSRCANLREGPLVIGEIGFGTGLNFVTFGQCFLDCAPAGTALHFVSLEAKPLDATAFARMAARRCAQQPLYRALAANYPPLLSGWHRRRLGSGRITLSLFFGSAALGLADLSGRLTRPVDAWLLDGFDPRRNPDCWSEGLLHAIAALSAPGTGIATFTAAGSVRRGLSRAGFAMTRIDQRPHKRHSLSGHFRAAAPRLGPTERSRPRHVTVVGGGLAGLATCQHLRAAGTATTLIDAPANALPLPGTVLHTRLQSDGGPASRMRLSAYLAAAQWYRQCGLTGSGALQFTSNNVDQARLERSAVTYAGTGDWLRWVDASTAGAIAGTRLAQAGLYFADSLRVDTAAIADCVLADDAIDRRTASLVGLAGIAGDLTLQLDRGTLATEAVVLCTGCPPALPQTANLEVLPVAGQLDLVTLRARLAVPLFGDGYLCPLGGDRYALGATYEQRPWQPERATAHNLGRASAWWRRLHGGALQMLPGGYARGVRAVSSDRLPIIGALDPDYASGIYVNLGHGSNGTATAPLGAAIIAELLGGEFAPATTAELAAVAPARFAARQARRGLRHGAMAELAKGLAKPRTRAR